jgi:type I restriction enzyme S subunit
LYYFLRSAEPELLSRVTRGATVHRLSTENIRNLSVPLPPLPEQKRIVAILDEAFEGIAAAVANAEKNLANARELFESYLNAILKEKHADDRTLSLAEACVRIKVGHVGPMASKYIGSGVTFLRSQNIRPFELDLTEVKFIDDEFHSMLRKSSLKPGDVAIVRTGYPGTAAVVPESLGEANCADLVIATPQPDLLPDYLAMLLNSHFGKQLVAGNLTGAAQKHFNVTAAKKVRIQLPPLGVQQRAIERFKESAIFCRQLEQRYQTKISLLNQLKQSLLQKAFSGELKTLPDQELAEAVA